jgi:hypothetical protein
MRLDVALDIHAHESRELDEAGIDAPPAAAITPRHLRNQVALEPIDAFGPIAPPIAAPSLRCPRCRPGSPARRPNRTSWSNSMSSSDPARCSNQALSRLEGEGLGENRSR